MRTKLLFLLLTPLLVGCQQNDSEHIVKEDITTFDYNDFEELNLEWKNLFSPAKSQYFVYIYSISCGHCKQIKKEVLEFVNMNKELFYLMEYSGEIPTKSNVADSIGKEKIEEIYILGTPTLLGITNWSLSLNIAGENDILNYLSSLPHLDNC